MWEIIKDNGFLVGALTGSLAAYLLGLLVSYWRREKRWIGFSVSSRLIVEKGHPDLSLRYKNRDIERLHSHAVTIRNIGNRPLSKQTVRVELPEGGQIVAHELDKPRGATFNTTTPDARTVLVDCDLLNPGEVFVMGVTVVDSVDDELAVTARGENLVCKQISQTVNTQELLDALASTSIVTRFALDVSRALVGTSASR